MLTRGRARARDLGEAAAVERKPTTSGPLWTVPPACAASAARPPSVLLRDHALGRRLQVEGGGQQRARILTLGTGEHLGRGSLLHHFAVAHDQKTAAERGDHPEIVRNDPLNEIPPLLQPAQTPTKL